MWISNQTANKESINTHWIINKSLSSKIFHSSRTIGSFIYHQQLLFRKCIPHGSNAQLNLIHLHRHFSLYPRDRYITDGDNCIHTSYPEPCVHMQPSCSLYNLSLLYSCQFSLVQFCLNLFLKCELSIIARSLSHKKNIVCTNFFFFQQWKIAKNTGKSIKNFIKWGIKCTEVFIYFFWKILGSSF